MNRFRFFVRSITVIDFFLTNLILSMKKMPNNTFLCFSFPFVKWASMAKEARESNHNKNQTKNTEEGTENSWKISGKKLRFVFIPSFYMGHSL